MGAKQTKIDGCYLPATPTTLSRVSTHPIQLQQPIMVQTDFNEAPEDFDRLDPRSPNGCRTPMSILSSLSSIMPQQQQQKEYYYQQPTAEPTQSLDNPLSMLRKRFLRGFSYNLNDPRSPNLQLNRTPLVFDDLKDKTFNLDDTFADLFVESRAPVEPEKSCNVVEAMQLDMEVESKQNVTELNGSVTLEIISLEDEETMPCSAKLLQTPATLQPEADPRSPTVGVDRTPIIFTDDDEANEDARLENILATLSLNLSSASSIASFNAASSITAEECFNTENAAIKPLANKHLERVRLNGGRRWQRIPQKAVQRRRQQIYEDLENSLSSSPAVSTPKKKRNVDSNNSSDSAVKRTPLSCVKNRSFLRSRSVELSDKALKARLSLTSFDDSLNPQQSAKVANLRIMQGLEDSFEM